MTLTAPLAAVDELRTLASQNSDPFAHQGVLSSVQAERSESYVRTRPDERDRIGEPVVRTFAETIIDEGVAERERFDSRG